MSITLVERSDGIRIIQLMHPGQAAPFRASFAGAYQTIFAEPPYSERFSSEEAAGVLLSTLQIPENLTLLAVEGDNKVVGFGLAIPLRARRDIVRALQGLVPVRHSYYLAELGVLESHRGGGLGHQLVKLRMERIDARRYTHIVLRTSALRNASYEMYRRMGFDDMGVYMEVPSPRTDGRETTDRRLFLSRVISAPDEAVID
ncbi:MAG: ribosomal protein S18 acetylase RimI-like enzyme [Myxococcota bacterium]